MYLIFIWAIECYPHSRALFTAPVPVIQQLLQMSISTYSLSACHLCDILMVIANLTSQLYYIWYCHLVQPVYIHLHLERVYKGVPYDTSGGLCPEGLQEEARRPVSYDLYAVVLLNLPNEWSTLHPDWILIFPIIIHKSST